MRSAKYPWGSPWILGKRRSKLRQANRLIKKAILACAAGGEVGTPYVLEFPEDLGLKQGRRPASIWQLACTKSLAEATGGHRIALYQRWFGTPFLKPTGLLTTCTPTWKLSLVGWPKFDEKGRYTGPLTYEHAEPMQLGAENTAATAAYPPLMNKAIAEMVVQTIKRRMLVSAPAEGSDTAVPNGGLAAAYAALERDVDLFADMDFEAAAATTSTVHENSNSRTNVSAPAPSTPPIGHDVATSGVSNLIPVATITQIAKNGEYIKGLPSTSSDVKMLPATSSEDKKEIRMLPGWSATSMEPGGDSSVRVVKGAAVGHLAGINVDGRISSLEAFTLKSDDRKGSYDIVDAWQVGPDEPTSDEDADRGPKMKKGQGRCGMGSSIRLEAGVEKRPFHDGAGLCSPGRWLPHKRLADPVSIKLFAEIRNLLASSFADLPGLACEIAGGEASRRAILR